MATGLDESLTRQGAELVPVVGRRQHWAIQAAWRAAFAPDWHDWSGPMNDRDCTGEGERVPTDSRAS